MVEGTLIGLHNTGSEKPFFPNKDPPCIRYDASPLAIDDIDDIDDHAAPFPFFADHGDSGEEDFHDAVAESGGDYIPPYDGDFEADRAAHGLPAIAGRLPDVPSSFAVADVVTASPERAGTSGNRPMVIYVLQFNTGCKRLTPSLQVFS